MVHLGHVVLYVRDLQVSMDFYQQVVGLDVTGKVFDDRAAILTGGSCHHELLLIEVGDAPGPLQGRRIGLYHIGWYLGDSLDDLKSAKKRAETFGCPIDGLSDHTISFSLYTRDPADNEIELYIDNPDIDWRKSDEWMEQPVKPLAL